MHHEVTYWLTVGEDEDRTGAVVRVVGEKEVKGTKYREGYMRLRNLVWPPRPEARNDNALPWLESPWLEGYPLAKQMHRWVLVTENQEVVGHLAAWPQFYRINGQRVVAHTPADFMVLPRYGFHALPLMRRFFHTVQNCVTCDRHQEVIGIETRLGAEEVGKLQYATTLLDARTLLNARLPVRIPAPIPKLLTRGFRAVDEALSSGFGDNLRPKVLEGFDESFDGLFEKIAADVPCTPEKDAAFLRWRYGPGSPQAPVIVLGVKGDEDLLGYAVLRESSWVFDSKRGYLLDLTALPGRHDVAWALLREAVRHFVRVGTYVIQYRFLESPTSPRPKELWRLGFVRRNSNRHTLLVKFADRDLHKTACRVASWSYVTGDGEASFWIDRNY